MKRLAMRGSLFLLIGLFILHVLARVVETVSPDGTAYLLRLDQRNISTLLANADEAQAIAVGSSHGDDIDFSATGYRGYQLSRAWGDVFETQYYLRYFVPKLPKLEAVFIPVSYFTFTWDNASVERLAVRRTHLYTAIPSARFIAGDLWRFLDARVQRLFPVKTILREDNWKGVFHAIGARRTTPPASDLSSADCPYLEADALAKHAHTRAMEQVTLSAAMVARRGELATLTYDVLAETVRSLRAQGIRVVLFTPPYSEPYTSTYEVESPKAINLMQKNAQRLREELGAEYLDFSRDARFVRDLEVFADSDHLNSCGKRLFSKQLDISLRGSHDQATKIRERP